jgi:TetR/AcrR family transcriptional regulator
MISKFFNLEPEKQQRIINASIKEFALKGFDKASTNEIVKDAEISKGSLFHYFQNKKDLYLFLYDYFMEIITDGLFAKINWEERDLLQKYRQIVILKFELLKKHPEMFQFVKNAYEEDSLAIKKELEIRDQQAITKSYAKLFQSIDTSRFKKGLNIEKAINIIVWTMEGLSHQYQEKMKLIPVDQIKLEDLLIDMDSYIETLKLSLYQ